MKNERRMKSEKLKAKQCSFEKSNNFENRNCSHTHTHTHNSLI